MNHMNMYKIEYFLVIKKEESMDTLKNTNIYIVCEDSDRKLITELIDEHNQVCNCISNKESKCLFWNAAFLGACASDYDCVIGYIVSVGKFTDIEILTLLCKAPINATTRNYALEMINNATMGNELRDNMHKYTLLIENVLRAFNIESNEIRLLPNRQLCKDLTYIACRNDYICLYRYIISVLPNPTKNDLTMQLIAALNNESINIVNYITAYMFKNIYGANHYYHAAECYNILHSTIHCVDNRKNIVKVWVKNICRTMLDRNITFVSTYELLNESATYGYYDLLRLTKLNTPNVHYIMSAIQRAITANHTDIADYLITGLHRCEAMTVQLFNRFCNGLNALDCLVALFQLIPKYQLHQIQLRHPQVCHLLNHNQDLPDIDNVRYMVTYRTIRQKYMRMAVDQYCYELCKHYDKNISSIISEYVCYETPVNSQDAIQLNTLVAEERNIKEDDKYTVYNYTPKFTRTSESRHDIWGRDDSDEDRDYDDDDFES